MANDVIPKDLIANGLDLLNKVLELLDSDLGIILTRLTMLTGIGWGMTSLVNASKVLPAVVGQISNFAKLLSGATIVIPKAAAEVGGLTASLATLQAVALPVIAIISALGVAIYTIVEKARKNKQAIDEMSSSAIQFKESIDNLNKSAVEEKAKIEATVSSVDIYLKRIEELDKKSHLNNVEQAEYHALLQKIVDVMPSVASSIDLQNNKIIGGTSAIYDQIEAWKKLAQQQAYQSQMSELYKQKADIEFQLAEQRVELLEAEKSLQEAQANAPDVTRYYDPYAGFINELFGGKRQTAILEEEAVAMAKVKNIQKAIDTLENSLASADAKIESAGQTLANVFGSQITENAEEENVWDFVLDASLKQLKEENALDVKLKQLKEEFHKLKEKEDDGGYIRQVAEEIKFSMDEYVSASEKYIDLLSSQYTLLELQGASQEELVAKIKEIQETRHKEAEILRTVLENAELLELTQEDIYEINTKINECSIDWWNWQNKIKDSSDEIKENYEEITDNFQELIGIQREELNTQKNAITALASLMSSYYDEQISNIDKQISALREANEETENQITLQEKMDALARAKQNKVLVYNNGKFQYVGDVDAVSSAAKDLQVYQKQQELEKQIKGLEEEKEVLNNLKASWSEMVSSYEEEQDKWLISQELGINTALEGWERLVTGAEEYARQYKEIMASLANLDEQEAAYNSSGGGGGGGFSSATQQKRINLDEGLPYDPNVDYHALMLQSTTADELNHWAKYRDAKIEGEGLTPIKSTSEIAKEWFNAHSYASGTLSARKGLSLVGENGAELRVLNGGDGIIPSSMTANLMSWGSITPNQFKMQALGNFNKGMQVTIQALNLPNVSDGIGFVEYVKNNMFGQVLSLVH